MTGRTAPEQGATRAAALEVQRRFGIVQGLEVTRPYAFTADYLQRNLSAGVTGINVTLACPEARRGITPETWSFTNIIESIEEWHEAAAAVNDARVTIPVESAEDIVRAQGEGKVGVILGIQGAGYWLDRKLVLLRTVYRLGVRIVGVSYQRRDIFADGTGEPGDAGLSSLGHAFVREMNRVGVVLDLSHMGHRASLEALEVTEHPVIFSHSNVRALCDSPRNLSDRQLDALARNGGVVGIATLSPLLSRDGSQPTVDTVITHIDYVARRIGVDHVGLGMDYGHARRQEDLDIHNQSYGDVLGGSLTVENAHARGLDGPQDLVNVTVGLLERGHSREDVGKILSGNFLRVFRIVWGH